MQRQLLLFAVNLTRINNAVKTDSKVKADNKRKY